MSRSQFYHIDAMVSNTLTSAPVVSPVVQPATQPVVSSTTFTRPTTTPVLSSVAPILEAPIDVVRPATLTAVSIAPTLSTIATRPTVTVPISDVVPVTVTIPTSTATTPTYGGGGGGGAINTAKPATKEMMIQATKPSFLKRNWMPILLIGTAVFIFIKKPIK